MQRFTRSTSTQRKPLPIVMWFLAGFGTVFATVVVAFPSLLTTAAAVPSCILDGDYGQVGAIEDETVSTGDESRGTRSNMYIGGSYTCQRISSLYVISSNENGFVEFGWVVGYSNCTDTTNSNPRLFWVSREATTGIEDCGISSTNPTPGQYDVFRIDDSNANTFWGPYFNNTLIEPNGIDLDFTRGWSLTGMERGAASESGYAHWDDLFEYHDSNGWTVWDNPSEYDVEIPDPDYNYTHHSDHDLASELP